MSDEEFTNRGNKPNDNEKKFIQFGSNMWHSIGAPIMKTDHSKESNDDFAQKEIFCEGKAGSVFELLSGLKSDDKEALSRTFLAMTSSAECCITIRQSRYLAVLVALIHGKEASDTAREQASKALHNIVQQSAENKQNRREAMVYKLITQLLQYCISLKNDPTNALSTPNDLSDDVPTITQTVALLMKFSFNEEYRRAMCEFGALHTLAKLIETDHFVRQGDVLNLSPESIAIRRYAAMALTNLTFRDSNNKALLCSFKEFMEALVAQLQSPDEDLCQVTASVLRNLSWRADSCIKKVLCDIHAVTSLMKTALRVEKESTLKAVLSALWNLSAHSNLNKDDICRVDGAIEYLVKMLNYQAPSGTLVIVENVGGILRNISSLIARQDDNSYHRAIIRKHNCLYVLLRQLTSPSLTVVSNACGTLWNLSARCAEDQRTLISLGAMDMLRSLTHSKHKMISMACAAALKNLMNARLDVEVNKEDDRICDSSLLSPKRHLFEREIGDRLQENNGTSSSSYKGVLASKSNVDEVYNFGESSSCHPIVNFADRSQREIFKKEVDRSSAIAESDFIVFDLTEKENNDCDMRDGGNSNSPLTAFNRSGISTKNILSENKLNGNDYMTYHKHNNSSSSEDDLHNSKINGFRKCEEPYDIDDSFSNYAETDLDQTTNFSLRFHEQGRPDVERNEMQKEEVVDDDCTTSHVVDVSGNENMSTVCAAACDETPLMFSRSSSLDSVDICSPPVDDDHGSIGSDFSHGVSGVISPSELPASPSETAPQSPRSGPRNIASKPLSALAPSVVPVTSCGVFEDTVTVFKDENTPLHFSVATSLSSLTFDDDAPVLATTAETALPHLSESSTPPKQRSTDRLSPTRLYQPPSLQDETLITSPHKCEIEISGLGYDDYDGVEKEDCVDVTLSPEEEQAVLDACIDQGMPTVHRKFKSKTSEVAPEFMMSNRYVNISQSAAITDSTINFCTEDTPVSISHAASNSDLSLLCPSEDSFLQNSILPLSSCVDDQDIIDDLPDEEQEKLLNLCIATGQSLNFNAGNKRTKTKPDENLHKSLHEGSSSYSSTLSEVTEDLPVEEDRPLLKDMTESANLVVTCNTDSDYSFLQDVDDGELTDNESEHLLNQCIALGIQNMKDSTTDRPKDLSDLENIGPPSFLAEANLDNSLTFVEEIADYPSCHNEVVTPKQRRNQLKDRYQTYTVKISPTKLASSISSESEAKVEPNKLHRSAEKDRFKTRTLSKYDFEEIAKSQKPWSPEFSRKNASVGDSSPLSDSSGQQDGAQIVKSSGRAKSGIPIVRGKPCLPKNHDTMKSTPPESVKSTPPNELPIAGLQRQNTFTKDEPSSIPVRKNLLMNYSNDKKLKPSSPIDNSSPQFRSGIPSRIKEPSPKVVSRIPNSSADSSFDFAKNRWSVSENNLISSGVSKTPSNTNLNVSLNGSLPINNAVSSKISPSTSQSALPVRKEWTTRNVGNPAIFKK